MLSLNSLQLPHSMSVLALHHDCQLFTGISILALASRPCIAVDSAVQYSGICLNLIKLKVVSELVEACTAAVNELHVTPLSRTTQDSQTVQDFHYTHETESYHRC